MTIYEFASLSSKEKIRALKKACFCDTFQDGDQTIYVYYLDGFFVEEIIKEKCTIDFLPFKRGYKVPCRHSKDAERDGALYTNAA